MGSRKPLPYRNSNRLAGYDYSLAGAYFVTLVTHGRELLFGELSGGEMHLNSIGEIAQMEWQRTEILRPNVTLDAFVVMPNHIHWILLIQDVGADRRPPNSIDPASVPLKQRVGGNRGKTANIRKEPLRRKGSTLGSIIAGYKSAATKQINQLQRMPRNAIWQRNYHDRIIRNEEELQLIRTYIAANPDMWHEDEDNPNNVLV